jgi:hypothetical protein
MAGGQAGPAKVRAAGACGKGSVDCGISELPVSFLFIMAKIHSSPFFRGILQNRIFLKRA